MSEGVCEAPTFMEWSTMVVPTYPEGGSHALQVCQHLHQVVRVGDFVGLSETGRTWCSRLLRYVSNKAGLTGQTVPGRRIPGHWPYLGPDELAETEPVFARGLETCSFFF